MFPPGNKGDLTCIIYLAVDVQLSTYVPLVSSGDTREIDRFVTHTVTSPLEGPGSKAPLRVLIFHAILRVMGELIESYYHMIV